MNLSRMLGASSLGGSSASASSSTDIPLPDSAETVHISSLALLKMLKHGRAGVPMEVMGLMLGEFVDDFTIQVTDVFAMPQSGSSVSVEAVDPVYQTAFLECLARTGRNEIVVGWYHSHPGFGCWLSQTDCNTQQSFEQLHPRAVAVVIDPIQSVKGKVVIDAFRLINPHFAMMGVEPRQTTSNVGSINKPSIQALIHGLNRHYYSLNIDYRKNDLEAKMLSNVHATNWKSGLVPCTGFHEHSHHNEKAIKSMLALSKDYNGRVQLEESKTREQIIVETAGKIDPKRHLKDHVDDLLTDNIDQSVGTSLDTIIF